MNLKKAFQLKQNRAELESTEDEISFDTALKKRREYEKIENAEYPWEQCIADMKSEGHDQEGAEKICGAIRAGTAN